jgi:hypothetical protein
MSRSLKNWDKGDVFQVLHRLFCPPMNIIITTRFIDNISALPLSIYLGVIMVIIEGQCIRCKARKTSVNPAFNPVFSLVFTEVFQVLHWLHSPSITTIITTKYTDNISAASLKYKIYVYETKNWDKGGIHRGFSCFAPNILSLYNHHNHAKIYKQCQCSILKDNVYNVYETKNWVNKTWKTSVNPAFIPVINLIDIINFIF